MVVNTILGYLGSYFCKKKLEKRHATKHDVACESIRFFRLKFLVSPAKKNHLRKRAEIKFPCVYASDNFYQRILLANNKTKALTSRKLFLGSFSQTLFFGGREATTGNTSAVRRLNTMAISLFFNFKMRCNNINLLHFIFS